MAKKTKKVTKNKKKSVKKSSAPKKVVATKGIGFIPMGDRVLVRPAKTGEEVTSYGLIIPASTSDEKMGKEKPLRGTVVALGDGRRGEDGTVEPLSLSVGDEILFSGYGFDEIRLDGRDYYIVSALSIFGTIK